ncbi:MAG: hypothetical protein ACO225_03625 [Ilumatobacteraceae bacterium]
MLLDTAVELLETMSIAVLTGLLDATDAAEFRRRAEEVVVGPHSVGRPRYRMDRLAILGASMGRPRLAGRVGAARREHLERQGPGSPSSRTAVGCHEISMRWRSRCDGDLLQPHHR